MPTTSNFGWTTPADTDLVKDGAAAIRTLGNGIDTSLVDLKGGTTGQVLTKASNTDLDFNFTTPGTGGLVHINTTAFSAVGSQSINTVFSATYDYYKIIVTCYGSAAAALDLRLRVSGADNSSAVYNYQRLEVIATVEDGNRSTNQTSWRCGEYDDASNIPTNFDISLYKPFDAVHTTMRSQNTSLSNAPDGIRIDYLDCVHKADTSFTGFTILASSGNMTGSVSVFGYAKA